MGGTRLCLVRHGETAWNAEGRVQGQLDIPLSPTGLAQARAVAAALAGESFDAIYSSDLVRVRQTAQSVVDRLKKEPVLDARLRERHYGKFQSVTYAEAKEKFPEDYAQFRAKDLDFDFGTGESLKQFAARSLAVVEEIVERHKGKSILVFTHGGVLEIVRRHATGAGLSTPRDFEIPNCAINRLEVEGADWRIGCWAEIGHLSMALDDLPD
jgi:2,3-bisphosphoglycerate-dependent phosphoglycerate mutase